MVRFTPPYMKGDIPLKKVFAVLAAAALFMLSFAPLAVAETTTVKKKDYSDLKGTTLNVFNWGEYISDGADDSLDVNAEFEKKYGIHVNYTNYDTNETLYTKLTKSGSNYDVVIPSDYMVQRLIAEGYLEKLDFSNIPNYKNILKKYKNFYYDPDNMYSVPYTYGMLGLIYNKKMMDSSPDRWSVMWNGQYAGKILMIDNPRDAFAIAQMILGQDVNTTDKNEWKAAAELLKEQKPLVSSYVMDEVFDKMVKNTAAMAPYYAGDYLTMAQDNKDLGFVYPKEGTNIFIDAMCIPKGAQNKTAAELYINFMLQTNVAVANANYIGYASPNKTVLTSDDYDYKGNKILYPEDLGTYNIQYYENLDADTIKLIDKLWGQVKAEGNESYTVYIGLGAAAIVAGALVVYSVVRKKRRQADV